MDKDEVIAVLRDHAAELQAAGVLHLSLFGSVARGEATPESDVDLLAEYDPAIVRSLLTISGLHCQLVDILGTDVDLSSVTTIREPIRRRALRDAIHVF